MISVTKNSRRNSTGSHILFRLAEDAILMNEISENLERSAQQAVIDENSAQRKLYLTEHDGETQN